MHGPQIKQYHGWVRLCLLRSWTFCDYISECKMCVKSFRQAGPTLVVFLILQASERSKLWSLLIYLKRIVKRKKLWKTWWHYSNKKRHKTAKYFCSQLKKPKLHLCLKPRVIRKIEGICSCRLKFLTRLFTECFGIWLKIPCTCYPPFLVIRKQWKYWNAKDRIQRASLPVSSAVWNLWRNDVREL